MAKAVSSLQRLRTLELLLLWEGVLNRSRLASLLGLGDIRSSQLIQEFRTAYPQWVSWNTKTRSYHATGAAYADRNDNASSLAKYLSLVELPYVVADVEPNGPICVAFPDLSTPNPKIFASLQRAIRLQSTVLITYRSMNEPAPHQRTIAPHHLVRAGRRWHVRAYCEKNQDFRDYALGRIVSVTPTGTPSEQSEHDDATWNARVPIRLVAHPDLTYDRAQVIRFEYFKDTAARVVTCRGALVAYFVQDVRAAIDTKVQVPPDYQLAVENIDEVKPWLFPR